jgi:hypothetical protein
MPTFTLVIYQQLAERHLPHPRRLEQALAKTNHIDQQKLRKQRFSLKGEQFVAPDGMLHSFFWAACSAGGPA